MGRLPRIAMAVASLFVTSVTFPVVAGAADREPVGVAGPAFALVRKPDGSLATAEIDARSTVRGATTDAGSRVLVVVPDITVRGAQAIQVDPPEPDPLRTGQAHLDDLDFEAAWEHHDGRGVLVAVVDSGVDPAHEEFAPGQVVTGACLLGGGGASSPCTPEEAALPLYPHGTAAASLIAAAAGNGRGISGAAPGASILSVRVLGPNNEGSLRDVTDGILAAVDGGADVLNLSLEVAPSADQFAAVAETFRIVVEQAKQAGAVVVAAAGNQALNGNPRVLPAATPGVLAVGSLAAPGQLSPTSSTGDYVDLVAHGVGLDAALPGDPDGYAPHGGTSFAAPLWPPRPLCCVGRSPTPLPQRWRVGSSPPPSTRGRGTRRPLRRRNDQSVGVIAVAGRCRQRWRRTAPTAGLRSINSTGQHRHSRELDRRVPHGHCGHRHRARREPHRGAGDEFSVVCQRSNRT